MTNFVTGSNLFCVKSISAKNKLTEDVEVLGDTGDTRLYKLETAKFDQRGPSPEDYNQWTMNVGIV